MANTLRAYLGGTLRPLPQPPAAPQPQHSTATGQKTSRQRGSGVGQRQAAQRSGISPGSRAAPVLYPPVLPQGDAVGQQHGPNGAPLTQDNVGPGSRRGARARDPGAQAGLEEKALRCGRGGRPQTTSAEAKAAAAGAPPRTGRPSGTRGGRGGGKALYPPLGDGRERA